MFSRVQLTYSVFLGVCDSSTIRLVQTLGDVLVAALSCSGRSDGIAEPAGSVWLRRQLCCLLPSVIAEQNLNFRKMKTLHFCKSTFLLYLSWSLSSLRTKQLQVFPLMSAWSRGKASVTGQHHCSLTACQIRPVPVKRKLNHPLKSSNLPQDSEGFIYCTSRFYAVLISNTFSCVEHPVTHLVQLLIPLA